MRSPTSGSMQAGQMHSNFKTGELSQPALGTALIYLSEYSSHSLPPFPEPHCSRTQLFLCLQTPMHIITTKKIKFIKSEKALTANCASLSYRKLLEQIYLLPFQIIQKNCVRKPNTIPYLLSSCFSQFSLFYPAFPSSPRTLSNNVL